MDSTIVISVISLLGTISVAIGSFLNTKKQSKSAEMEASSSLINAALSINKQELETARVLNTILLEDYNNLFAKQKDLSEKYDEIHDKYNKCIETLEQKL